MSNKSFFAWLAGHQELTLISSPSIDIAAAAVKTAAEIASKAPVAVRGTKIYLLHSRDHG